MFFVVAITAILLYYSTITIEAEVPEKANFICNIEEKSFQERKVFIMSPKIEESNKILEKSQAIANNESNNNLANFIDAKKINSDNKYILYLHGGSYVGEPEKDHWEFLQDLVVDTNMTVILPDYPLAPKYTYKEVFKMIKPLYEEILKKVNHENIILMGDSAGGGMALALEEYLSEENLELPQKLILISPWLDVTMTNSKIDEVQKNDKDLNKDALKLAGKLYAGKDGMDNYLVNPINGPLEKLKNVTIYTGTYDILNPDVHILVEKAKNVNVNIFLKEYETAGHIWIVRKNNNPSKIAEEAYKDLLKTIDN